MRMPLKKFVSRRRVVALLSALVFGLARQGSAQSNAITDYSDLVNALNTGITTITNFQTPLTISLTTVGTPTIQITNNVTIDAGTNSVIFRGNGTNGGTCFFYVHPNASLTLNNLMLTNGGSTNGGAIYNEGTLVISNCLLTGNYATNATGANGSSGTNLDSNGANGGDGGTAEMAQKIAHDGSPVRLSRVSAGPVHRMRGAAFTTILGGSPAAAGADPSDGASRRNAPPITPTGQQQSRPGGTRDRRTRVDQRSAVRHTASGAARRGQRCAGRPLPTCQIVQANES